MEHEDDTQAAMPEVASPKKLPASPVGSQGLPSSAVNEEAAQASTDETLLEEAEETTGAPAPGSHVTTEMREDEDTIPGFLEVEPALVQPSAPATSVNPSFPDPEQAGAGKASPVALVGALPPKCPEIAKAATPAHPLALVGTLPPKFPNVAAAAATQAQPMDPVETHPPKSPEMAKAGTPAHPLALVGTLPPKSPNAAAAATQASLVGALPNSVEIAKATSPAHPLALVGTLPAKSPQMAKATTSAHRVALVGTLPAKSPQMAKATTSAHRVALVGTLNPPKSSQMAKAGTLAHPVALVGTLPPKSPNVAAAACTGPSNSPSSSHEAASPLATNMGPPARHEHDADRIAQLEQLQALKRHQDQAETPTAAAIDRRLRRLMKPTAEGLHRVSEEIRNLWSRKTSKDQVVRMFQECNYSPDRKSKKTHAF